MMMIPKRLTYTKPKTLYFLVLTLILIHIRLKKNLPFI